LTYRSHYQERALRAEAARRLVCELADQYRRSGAKTPELRARWSVAADAYREALRQAYPPDFESMLDSLRAGSPALVDEGVAFLEADPWFATSGYAKANLIRFIGRMTLTDGQREALKAIVIGRIIDGGAGHEFRRYCRLAVQLVDADFRNQIERLTEHPDPNARRRARWVMDALDGRGRMSTSWRERSEEDDG